MTAAVAKTQRLPRLVLKFIETKCILNTVDVDVRRGFSHTFDSYIPARLKKHGVEVLIQLEIEVLMKVLRFGPYYEKSVNLEKYDHGAPLFAAVLILRDFVRTC